jgi:hypothetical protein
VQIVHRTLFFQIILIQPVGGSVVIFRKTAHSERILGKYVLYFFSTGRYDVIRLLVSLVPSGPTCTRPGNLIPGMAAACHWGVESG